MVMKRDEIMSLILQMNSKNFASLDYADDQKRDVFMILPGGGYTHASIREAQPVADAFSHLGLHLCIYHYRETILRYPEINDEAFELLKKLKNDPLIGKIHVIGFSAGGHFALMLMEKYSAYFASGILCYAVVSMHQKWYHGGSFMQLLGDQYENEILRKQVSLEHHVHKNMPPIFIFHTVDDEAVPIENALVLIAALKEQNIPVEAHLFPYGRHGISIATAEVAFDDMSKEAFVLQYGYLNTWVHLARSFLKRYLS